MGGTQAARPTGLPAVTRVLDRGDAGGLRVTFEADDGSWSWQGPDDRRHASHAPTAPGPACRGGERDAQGGSERARDLVTDRQRASSGMPSTIVPLPRQSPRSGRPGTETASAGRGRSAASRGRAILQASIHLQRLDQMLPPQETANRPRRAGFVLEMWRRRWDSDPRIEVLQTSPLTTWVRRPGEPVGGSGDAGWPSRIRTSVHGSKVRCPTARRRASGTRAAMFTNEWSGRRDSNPRPSPWQGDALPTEPLPLDDRVRGDGAERQT